MKITYKIALFALFISIQSIAQQDKVIGSWLLTRVEVAGEIQEPFATFDFNKDASLVTMDINVGTWEYKNNQILMTSSMDKDFNGINEINKLTDTEMILIKDQAKLFYEKIDKQNLITNNKNSGIMGTWEFKNKESTWFLELKEPNMFKLLELEEGASSISEGEWIYNPKENILIFIGFAYEIRGKSEILEHTDSTLSFQHKEVIHKGIKRENNKEIERLRFNYEDFPEEMEEDISISPWTDFYEMIDVMSTIKSLEYQKETLQEEVNLLIKSKYLCQIKTEDEAIIIETAVSKDDKVTSLTTIKSQDFYGSMGYFPKKEPYPYRKVGEENIQTPAGSFQCIVIEGFQSDTKIKYWMIKDMPGIYAKIITEEEGVFDKIDYTVYTLSTINK